MGVILSVFGFSIKEFSLIQNPSNFFSSSLNLVLSIISLVFIIVIFLVQNANQEYSSRLSSVIFHDKYFKLTIFFILVGSIFNISGNYFGWKAPLTLIGYGFSVSTILLVISLMSFAGYFINISNLVEYKTQSIKKKISNDRIYRPTIFNTTLKNEDYISELTSDTQLIVDTCIKGIEKNQQHIVETCLDSLKQITVEYLEQTDRKDVNDDFLQELNNHFQFIGSTALEDYSRQKYSENVVEAIGDIGIEITKNREIGAQGTMWAQLLERFFKDSLEFDRTSTTSISIQKLGNMSIVAIQNGDYDSVRVYKNKLENISTICSGQDNPYLATLLQNIHIQYQKMYVSYLTTLIEYGYAPEYDLSSLIEEFTDSFKKAKSNYSYYNKQSLYAGLFGLNPFAGKMLVYLNDYSDLDFRTQQYIKKYLSQLVGFLREISLKNSEDNYLIYNGYTQFLYTFENISSIEKELKTELVFEFNDAWVELIELKYREAINNSENIHSNINERISDFTAFLVYFHRDEPEIIAELINPYVELFYKLNKEYSNSNQYAERNLGRFYKQLKLVGAWINRYHDTEFITPQLYNILVENFFEIPETKSRIPRPLMAKYGFPTSDHTSFTKGWWLRPDTLWDHTGFQDEITETLNGDERETYIKFHQRLKRDHKLSKFFIFL